jgi:hypothetical protein
MQLFMSTICRRRLTKANQSPLGRFLQKREQRFSYVGFCCKILPGVMPPVEELLEEDCMDKRNHTAAFQQRQWRVRFVAYPS